MYIFWEIFEYRTAASIAALNLLSHHSKIDLPIGTNTWFFLFLYIFVYWTLKTLRGEWRLCASKNEHKTRIFSLEHYFRAILSCCCCSWLSCILYLTCKSQLALQLECLQTRKLNVRIGLVGNFHTATSWSPITLIIWWKKEEKSDWLWS